MPVVIDWEEFHGIVRAAFFTVKRALDSRQAGICRHVMTEEAWQAVRAQIDVLRLDGCINLQRGLDVTGLTPGEHDVVGSLDRVTARLMVSGVDCVVNETTHQLVSGTRERSDHVEDWSFERSRDPDLLEQARVPKCPNCGGPLTVDGDGQCGFCHAVVPGAKTDWLVAAIGHPSEASVDPYMNTRATIEAGKVTMDALASQAADQDGTATPISGPHVAPAADAGLAAIQQHDPEFHASDLVVEAREVFFKLEEARNQLNVSPVRAMLSDALYATESARATQVLASGRNEVRAYLDITDVAFVDAASVGGRDRLVARVTATSSRSVVDLHSGSLLEGSPTIHPWAEDLVFERAATATTNALTGLLAHRCPACGRPAQVAEDGRCVHCAHHVTGGELDWILMAVRPVPS